MALLAGGVNHNFARPEVALRLYGVNMWSNENDIHLNLHVHFNDYAGRPRGRSGVYSGFSIYVPEKQYPNAATSIALAGNISEQLKQINGASDLPVESAGVIEDQDLIALGAQASLRGASVLTEYGYIYQYASLHPEIRAAILEELAWQTYRGVKTYFEPNNNLAKTRLLSEPITAALQEGLRGDRQVLTLQKALQLAGFYPPTDRSMNDCPINGNFGPCTAAAVRAFQSQNQLATTGYVGDRTLEKINELMASK